MTKRITIREVALDAGVSITAVSKALNGKSDNISAETIKRIEESAKKLKYIPNSIASSMITKRTNTIGIIVPNITNSFFVQVIKEIEETFRKHKYSLFISDSGDKFENDIYLINNFVNKNVDFLIYVPSREANLLENNKYVNELLHNLPIKYIIFDRELLHNENKFIPIDDIKGGYLATNYLLQNGHRRILVIAGPISSTSSNNRLEGYKKALKDNNIPFNEDLVVYGNYSSHKVRELIDVIFRKDFTGVFALSDTMGYTFIKESYLRGKLVPNDYSIIGYDDLDFSYLAILPLSSISRDKSKIANELVNIVISKIDEKDYIPIPIEPSLTIRDSIRKIK
ncbi:MAG: LacI family transcriptional regulator [Bacillales bacterium]|nr:LacI family transcriptional regulator [Bacillales bacterium]